MPGACDSTLRVIVVFTSPRPSMGRPKASTTRPMRAGPTGTSSTRDRAADVITLAQHQVVAEDHGADVVFLEIESQRRDDLAVAGGRDLQHLAGDRPVEAIDTGNAIANFEDSTDFLDIEDVQVRGFDLSEQDVLDLAGSERGVRGHKKSGERVGYERGGSPRCGRPRTEAQVRGPACEKYHKPGGRASWGASIRRARMGTGHRPLWDGEWLRPRPSANRPMRSTARRRASDAGRRPTIRCVVLERCDGEANCRTPATSRKS